MKVLRKIAMVTLALLMVLSCVPAMAAETGTIVGDTTLMAPPMGQFSAVEYTLSDGTNTASDAVFEITSAPNGVSLDGNKVVLNGSRIKKGNIYLTASSESLGVSASLTVKVNDYRLYTNFESAAVGSNPSDTTQETYVTLENLDGSAATGALFRSGSGYTTALVAEETDGNRYIQGTRDNTIVI